jgi:hypothetical protein
MLYVETTFFSSAWNIISRVTGLIVLFVGGPCRRDG